MPSDSASRYSGAYRPQQAVDHFVRWANNLEDTRTKAESYPDIDKNALLRDRYIAARSNHSRGSTVDLTLVSFQAGKAAEELDMGTEFDFFVQHHRRSFPDSLLNSGRTECCCTPS